MIPPQRCLCLVKGRHRYVFAWSPGRESELLAVLCELAEGDACDFDWYDAAVLSYQMGRPLDRTVETLVL